jgi:hypothetical protein
MKCLLILLLLPISLFAQSDRWKGLVIDEATPESTVRILGPAKSDEPKDHWHLLQNRWFMDGIGRKLRTLKYKNVEGFSDVRLKFDTNDKLVVIHLEPKERIPTSSFISSYADIEFRFDTELKFLTDLDRPRDGNPPRPRNTYMLIGATSKTAVMANVWVDVQLIQIVSRTLVNTKGADLLK